MYIYLKHLGRAIFLCQQKTLVQTEERIEEQRNRRTDENEKDYTSFLKFENFNKQDIPLSNITS